MGCVWIVRLCYCGFELAGATLSPTRISHWPDQSGELQSEAWVLRAVLLPSLVECLCPTVIIFFFRFDKVAFFGDIQCCASFNRVSVKVPVGLTKQNRYQHPLLPPLSCLQMVWDDFKMCWRYRISHQLCSASTVLVEPCWKAPLSPLLSLALLMLGLHGPFWAFNLLESDTTSCSPAFTSQQSFLFSFLFTGLILPPFHENSCLKWLCLLFFQSITNQMF